MSLSKLTLSAYLRKVDADSSTKQKYKNRYLEVRNKITSRWFNVTSLGHMVVYIRIPSEKVDVFYDVLIEFPFGRNSGSYRGFRNSPIKVYSNCPSFVFMNARYFDSKGYLISWMKDYYSPDTFAPPPRDDLKKIKAAQEADVRYEKSLYFAAMYLDELTPIQVLTEINESINVQRTTHLVQFMKSPEQIMRSRQKKVEIEKDKKKRAEENQVNVFLRKTVGKSPPLGSTSKKVSSVKKVATTKKVKHI